MFFIIIKITSSSTPLTVCWLKNDASDLPSSVETWFEPDTGIATMRISGARASQHTGIFTCQATNSAGVSNAQISVKVKNDRQ